MAGTHTNPWLDRAFGAASTVTIDGTIMMDLRFVAFDRIARDLVLRRLLVNYADRIEHGPASGDTACFIALQWTADHEVDAPSEAQLLTARVHMPRHRAGEHWFLDAILQRVGTALAARNRSEPITTRCVSTSREVMYSEIGTIFKASTYEVAPAPPRRHRMSLLELPAWPVDAQPGSVGVSSAETATVPGLN